MNQEEVDEKLVSEMNNGQTASLIYNGVSNLFLEYEAELFESMKSSSFKDVEKREEIYRQLKSLGTVKGKLLSAIQTGKMAKEQLSLIDRAKQSINNMIG
jgi:hypothetical protein